MSRAALYQNSESKEFFNYLYELESRGIKILRITPVSRTYKTPFDINNNTNRIIYCSKIAFESLDNSQASRVIFYNDQVEYIILQNDLLKEKITGDLVYKNRQVFNDIPILLLNGVNNIENISLQGWFIETDTNNLDTNVYKPASFCYNTLVDYQFKYNLSQNLINSIISETFSRYVIQLNILLQNLLTNSSIILFETNYIKIELLNTNGNYYFKSTVNGVESQSIITNNKIIDNFLKINNIIIRVYSTSVYVLINGLQTHTYNYESYTINMSDVTSSYTYLFNTFDLVSTNNYAVIYYNGSSGVSYLMNSSYLYTLNTSTSSMSILENNTNLGYYIP